MLRLVAIFAFVAACLAKNYLVETNNTLCGQNYQLSFEINPAAVVNDIGGVISVGDDLTVYFPWMESSFVVGLHTNQGTIRVRSKTSIPLNKWTSVIVDVRRRSIGLTLGGDSFEIARVSYGHIHESKTDFSVLNQTMDRAADATIRNLALECTDRGDQDAQEEDVQSLMYTRLWGTMEGCGGAKRLASSYVNYKIMNVRMTTLNGTADPFMVVHVIGAPPNRLFNVRVKLRSQESNSGFKYNFPAVSIPVQKTYNLNRAKPGGKYKHKELAFHNHSTTRELELSGYMGKNQIIPAATDYNMRIEIVTEVYDQAVGGMVSVVVGCARMRNLSIGDYVYSTLVEVP